MKGLLLKDWYVLTKQSKAVIAIIILYLFIPTLGSNMLFAQFATLLCAMIPTTLIAFDEKARWDKYALTLPYSRKDIVLSKYIVGIIALASVSVMYLIITAVSAAIGVNKLYTDGLVLLIPMVCASLILLSINLPMVFKFGVEKGRVFFILMTVLLGCGIGAFTSSVDKDSFNLAGLPWMTIIYLLIPVTLVVLAVSTMISMKIYENREL